MLRLLLGSGAEAAIATLLNPQLTLAALEFIPQRAKLGVGILGGYFASGFQVANVAYPLSKFL